MCNSCRKSNDLHQLLVRRRVSARPHVLGFARARRHFPSIVREMRLWSTLRRSWRMNLSTLLVARHSSSLGGGVAHITAARLHADGLGQRVRAFGLRPPGTLWISCKFGFDAKALDTSVWMLEPRRDPVSRLYGLLLHVHAVSLVMNATRGLDAGCEVHV